MKRITVAKGDGIGPEIIDATREIVMAVGAKIEIEEIEVGEKLSQVNNHQIEYNKNWELVFL